MHAEAHIHEHTHTHKPHAHMHTHLQGGMQKLAYTNRHAHTNHMHTHTCKEACRSSNTQTDTHTNHMHIHTYMHIVRHSILFVWQCRYGKLAERVVLNAQVREWWWLWLLWRSRKCCVEPVGPKNTHTPISYIIHKHKHTNINRHVCKYTPHMLKYACTYMHVHTHTRNTYAQTHKYTHT
jgi:hypothetical protein